MQTRDLMITIVMTLVFVIIVGMIIAWVNEFRQNK